ncbi:MAG: redoxin domain-containing protein [Phycisphaerales bacterium]
MCQTDAMEAWVHQIKSFYARFEGTVTRTPRGLVHNRAELARQFPDMDLDTCHFSDLHPCIDVATYIAFDDRRLRTEHVDRNYRTHIRAWDGKRETSLWHDASSGSDSYSLADKPLRGISLLMLASLSWLRGRPHRFWWSEFLSEDQAEYYGTPAEWTLVGRETFRGIDCYELAYRRQMLYIGVEDQLIHGLKEFAYHTTQERQEIQKAIMKEFNVPCESSEGLNSWLKTLTHDRRRAVHDVLYKRLQPFRRPFAEFWMLDYQEVAPGMWFPMWQGYDCYDSDAGVEPFISSTRDVRAVEVGVDQPLPDELFTIRFKEGVQVTDRRFDPCLIYPWKKNMSEQEYQVLIEAREKEVAPMREARARRDALIGRPAPPFPEGAAWLNSGTLTWDDLRGKVVILDFWSEGCGPCRNDLPTMCQLHKDRGDNGIVVIGIHNPGHERAAIDKVIEQFGIEYPICIDVAKEGQPETWGKLFIKDYHCDYMPYAFLIDRHGNIAGHGLLGEMVGTAHGLARQVA